MKIISFSYIINPIKSNLHHRNMTTIFDLPIEILTHISTFMRRIYWKFFRDSSKYFKENLSTKPNKFGNDVNQREIYNAMILLEKNGYSEDAKIFLKKNFYDSKYHHHRCLRFIRHGYLNCLQYLITKDISNKKIKSYCNEAIKYGQLDILEYLSENKNFNKNEICVKAVKRQKLSVLKWARSRDYTWNEHVCWVAVKKKNPEILKWITENGYPWDSDICLMAAKSGKLEILQFIKNNDYEWNSETYEVAKKFNRTHIMEWIKENYLSYDISKERNEICPLCSKKIHLTRLENKTCELCSYNHNDIYCGDCLVQCSGCLKKYCVQCNCVANCQSCNRSLCKKCMGPRCIKCKIIKCCKICMNQCKCLDCFPHNDTKNLKSLNSNGTIKKPGLETRLEKYSGRHEYSDDNDDEYDDEIYIKPRSSNKKKIILNFES